MVVQLFLVLKCKVSGLHRIRLIDKRIQRIQYHQFCSLVETLALRVTS